MKHQAVCDIESKERLMDLIERCARNACDFMSFSGMLAGSLSIYRDTEELAHVFARAAERVAEAHR